MSRDERKAMIAPGCPSLSQSRQCRLLSISRSSFYYAPRGESAENLMVMRRIDELYVKYPFYGSRQMVRHMWREGVVIGRHRVRRLMRVMGLEAIYQAPRTSTPHPEHRIYPYLLRDMTVVRPDHVWCADITYIPMKRGFLFLVAIMDWATRHVLAWRLSNTMDAGFCIEALNEALGDKRGVRRFASVAIPLDEALVEVALDLSGRPFLVWDVDVPAETIGSFDTGLAEDFVQALVTTAGITMHVRLISGRSPHHVLEAAFKGMARALGDAVRIVGDSVPSTKGTL